MKTYTSKVQFVKSSSNYTECPTDMLPEYAFVGRSNVGKSSLINYLAGNRKLAKISNQPGRTRLINHFIVDHSWYLVDLPGYGYSRRSKTERSNFIKMIYDYLQYRSALTCLFLLIDIRHAPQAIDLEFMRWMGSNKVPFALCFTKTDKLSSAQLERNSDAYKNLLLKEWEFLPPYFYTTNIKKQGKDEMLSFIKETNRKIASKN